MSELRPFFLYFGAKWRSGTRYPPPRYPVLVEPFAGGAGYALRHHRHRVRLIEKNGAIAALWAYLIAVKPAEILALPVLSKGQHQDEFRWPCEEARTLAGLWLNPGGSGPRRTASAWTSDGKTYHFNGWTAQARERVARQVESIRHWQIIQGDYTAAPDVEATWFIDPPYEGMGRCYPCGSEDLDFPALGQWCRARRGQVLVCEQTGATWLPFSSFGAFKSNVVNRSGRTRSAEALWMNDWPGAGLWLPGAEPSP